MNFSQAIVSCLNNYITFSGRARRSEFWYFELFCFIIGFVGGLVDHSMFKDFIYTYHIGPLGIITGLFILLPRLAVAVRRLHDVNRSGWWILIAATIIGIIPLIYWYCKAGDAQDNRFGTDPLAGK